VNGELWGRVTTVPWGMYFPADITGQLRHPSQLYEMFLEGILLFVILWSIRKIKFPVGYLTSFYLIGYGLARFTAEFFRQPDNDWFFLFLTIGQWFSIGVIIFGLILIFQKTITRKSVNFPA
jgi:phosphatidylglycerol:prolipoprotein diacylglycerol transferase